MLRAVEALLRPDRALENARAAATELSRRRVERDEVDLFLQRRGKVSRSA